MNVDAINPCLECLSYIVTLLGVPAALLVYIQQKSKERKEREYGTYNALDDKYLDFLKLCLENSELNFYPKNPELNVVLTNEQNSKKLLLFEILISILERAFLMYKDQSTKVKQEQWSGWNEYMRDWMERDDFYESWKILGSQWATDFVSHMDKIHQELTEGKSNLFVE